MSQSPRTITTSTTETTAVDRRPSLGMRLYAVIWWLGFASFTCAMFAWTLVLLPTLLFDRRGGIVHVATVSVWGWAVYALNPFWSLDVEGRDRIPWHQRGVLVANHDSLADILVVAATFRPFKFVSKKSVFSVPVLGWGMRLNRYIPLVRGSRESVVEMFRQCRGWLDRDVPVLLFPEGTRSPDGTVQQFKDGAFDLAVDNGAPVYPIVLAGTRDALPKHGLIAPLRSTVRVRVLDPVHPDEFDGNADRLREHVRALIVSEKAKLTREL